MAKCRMKRSNHVLATSFTSSSSPFSRVPLELCDRIYRMLLTTSWTFKDTLNGKVTRAGNQQTLAKTTELVSAGRFNLSLAILQVNQQIYIEASKILYATNEFIIVKIGPIYPQFVLDYFARHRKELAHYEVRFAKRYQTVPAFRELPEAKVTSPVLRATIAMQSEKLQHPGDWTTLIITPEAMPRLLNTLLNHGQRDDFYEHCFLALDFYNRNPSRHSFLHENILIVWEQMYGFREIRLTSNIDEVVSNHLKQHMDQCPFEDIMVHSIDMFHSKAESSYRTNDFATLYFYWSHLQRYWAYHEQLERTTTQIPNNSPFTQLPEFRLKEALNVTLYKVGVSLFGILRTLLCMWNYNLAVGIAKSPDDWLKQNDISMRHFKTPTCVAPILRAKFAFCCALALAGQGQTIEVGYFIMYGIACLRRYSHVYIQRTADDMFGELRDSIDNELIHRESRWRCGRKEKVGLKSKGGDDWQLHTSCLAFWDWLDIPDEDPGPETWREDGGLLEFGYSGSAK